MNNLNHKNLKVLRHPSGYLLHDTRRTYKLAKDNTALILFSELAETFPATQNSSEPLTVFNDTPLNRSLEFAALAYASANPN